MIDNSRQADLVPADKLSTLAIDVIGVGAIGRQVALQLASIGATNIRLIDPDIVDASNVCTQGFDRRDIERAKVDCVAIDLFRINGDIKRQVLKLRWIPVIKPRDVVFCCVDSMETRADIHREFNGSFFVDGRMLAEVGYVYPSYNLNSREAYIKTLFDDADAEPGRCTMRSTIYGANHVASVMVHQFVRWMRGQKPFACGGMVGQYQKLEYA